MFLSCFFSAVFKVREYLQSYVFKYEQNVYILGQEEMYQEITDSLVDAQSSAEERPRTEAEGRLSELQKKRLLALDLLGQEEMFQEITDSLVDAQSSAEKWPGTEAEGRLSDLQKKSLLALHLHGQEEMLNQEITDLLSGDEEGVALQAIEFWSSICRKEIRYKGSMPGDSDTHSRCLIQKALPWLVPMLLKTLFKQDEDQDKKDDILNLAAAGGTCLGLVAKTVGDAVIPLVKPFVLENISKPDWRYLEAAKHAYGSYLEGVTVEKLSKIDDLDLEYLLTAMRDQNRHVKSTAARTLSRIFQLDPPPATVISPKHHNIIMAVLPEIVKESPGVLTPMIGVLRISMKKLWVTDDDETERFDRAKEALICLQVIFQKLGGTDETADSTIKAAAAEIMPVLLNIFDIKIPTVHEKAKLSTVREKAFLAVGAIAYTIGPAFEEYTKRFLRYLVAGFKDQRVCSVCLGLFGDICRALDYKVLPFSHGIMPRLVKLLSSVDVSVKPPVFSCFGDLALAIGSESERLVPYVVPLMEEAAKIVDEETVEYGNQLKRSIFEAYSGLLQGCRSSKAEIMEPHVPHLLKFIEALLRMLRGMDESVLKAAVVVLGDLADALGPNVKKFEKQVAFCREFLGECLKSEDKQLKETATWTLRMMDPVRVFSKCG
ncbi:putative armadillo-like helical, importin beta family [Helianthus annuus]|nr:putative armadillo-like helical, importin beta family [Helianthus annuus]